MSTSKDSKLVLGGPPRVDLLPPEIKAGKQAAGVRRGLAVGVVAVIVLSAAGYGVAALGALNAANALSDEQDRTAKLLAEQTQYSEATTLVARVRGLEAALLTGTSTEIEWYPVLTTLDKLLPTPGKMAVNFTSASPIESHPQPVNTLQVPRVATLLVSVRTRSLFNAGDYLTKVRNRLPSVVDATATGSTFEEDDSSYVTSLTIHIDESALLKRFQRDEAGNLVLAPLADGDTEEATEDAGTDDAATEDTAEGTTDGTVDGEAEGTGE